MFKLSGARRVLVFRMTFTKRILLFTIAICLFVASLLFLRNPKLEPVNDFSLLNSALIISTTNTSREKIKSKCSIKADERGPHQKVMAFSLSVKGSSPTAAWDYIKLLKERVSEFVSLYPGIFKSIAIFLHPYLLIHN